MKKNIVIFLCLMVVLFAATGCVGNNGGSVNDATGTDDATSTNDAPGGNIGSIPPEGLQEATSILADALGERYTEDHGLYYESRITIDGEEWLKFNFGPFEKKGGAKIVIQETYVVSRDGEIRILDAETGEYIPLTSSLRLRHQDNSVSLYAIVHSEGVTKKQWKSMVYGPK